MTRNRLQAVRRALAAHHVDAFLVSENSHIRYLTGFTGSNAVCLVTPRRAVLITDGRYRSQAPAEVDGATVVIARQSLFAELSQRYLVRPGMKVGVEEEHLSAASLRTLRRLLPRCSFPAMPPLIERMSAVKDASEIKRIKRAVEITDAVFAKVLIAMEPGIRELDLAAEISYWHRKYGADSEAFDPIVASGPRAALPHARATTKKIRVGEVVVLDFGCRYQGYNSDMTRVVALGRPSAEMQKIHGIVREAQQRAIDAIRPGMEARALDAVARTHIEKAGYGKFFVHSLGHGLGIHIHDSLRISSLSSELLHEHAVVTIEPGIYLPGKGGVRIEDDVLITRGGCSVLTRSPRDLIVL